MSLCHVQFLILVCSSVCVCAELWCVWCSQYPQPGWHSAAQQQQLLHQLRHYSGDCHDPLPHDVPSHWSPGWLVQDPQDMW